ncbi:hematopoietic progenitor cell antigen CD34 isoform X3 [Synchiropus splendidus]|uniref:hematopoietic progenitor cell antigen CD34 isoform X3 n=1 Tax=Synchiropus splendidus TaxID=270530 RepID=UPI00237DD526|nr:hematopoietic progenitor cell antigen CD34 isoform X3 [Synchiropus splendidus]
MWRMTRLAGALLLLLLCSEVRSQDAGDTPTTDPPAGGSAVADGPVSTLAAGATAPPATESAAPAGGSQPPVTMSPDAPVTAAVAAGVDDSAALDDLVEMPASWECVTGRGELPVLSHQLPRTTNSCEETKRLLMGVPFKVKCKPNPESLCPVQLFQDQDMLMLSASHPEPSSLEEVINILNSKGSSSGSSSSSSSVFVGILVSGLLAAVALTVGYFKCQRRSDGKGAQLADEACPVDPQNQGNTLVSVAPLHPPPETQEKPNINGETPDAVKTETPPTNGHSAAKTADTEL